LTHFLHPSALKEPLNSVEFLPQNFVSSIIFKLNFKRTEVALPTFSWLKVAFSLVEKQANLGLLVLN